MYTIWQGSGQSACFMLIQRGDGRRFAYFKFRNNL